MAIFKLLKFINRLNHFILNHFNTDLCLSKR